MAKYRKKPVVIDAVQWTGKMECLSPLSPFEATLGEDLTSTDLFIDTLEGEMRAHVGDWVIKGVAGEIYPCKPAIFAATYEPAA